jgi:exonuclease SbcD
MKILHIADVHLDRPFVGITGEEARRRRADLFATFQRCLEAAREQAVDVVTIGGDLWEEEHVTVDTRRAVAYELGRLDIPVLMIAGNHDPLLPGGEYERTEWPANVHLFRSDRPEEVALADGVSIWGVSWLAGDLGAGFLRRPIGLDPARVNLLLLHGSAVSVAHFAEDAHCPFDPAAVAAAGFARCLAGHIHAASDDGIVVYPGSPEPLDWGETGRHTYALVTVASGGSAYGLVEVDLRDVNRRRYVAVEVDCGEASSSAEVAARVAAALPAGGRDLCLSLRLVGAVVPGCRPDATGLAARHRPDFAALRVEDATHEAIDVDAIARRRTVDGVFARRLLARILAADATGEADELAELELALVYGLGAMDGRGDLVDVG